MHAGSAQLSFRVGMMFGKMGGAFSAIEKSLLFFEKVWPVF